MPEILLLNEETIDKIAAGEVVERPASVVKELVENAIDAKATAVTVEIKEGGISFIRITDNGCGIERRQVPVAFLRHSTSKIRSAADLLDVRSLGFRGEALSSIAAVAQVELITKTNGELTGTRYVIEGSKEIENEEIGAPEGTTFIVRNLFYNVPARRKFLKTAPTEGGYVSDLMERMALSHPTVSFKFINNGQTKLHTSGNGNEKDLIYHIYGRDITASVLKVERETEQFTVRGFIGKPLISRGNRNYENYFINGRYVKSALIAKAIEEAYKGFLMQHQYPFTVLYLDMDPSLLDVNVHPSKMELRFAKNEEIYRALFDVVRSTISHRDFIPEVPVKEEKKETVPVVGRDVPEPFEKNRMQGNGKTLAGGNTQSGAAAQSFALQSVALLLADSRRASAEAFFSKMKTGDGAGLTVQEENLFAQPLAQSRRDAEETPLPEIPQPEQTRTAEAPPIGSDAAGMPSAQGADGQPQAVSPAEAGTSQKAPGQSIPSFEQQTLEQLHPAFLTADARRKHKIIGQLFDTYWLIEYEEKLFIIDQHAAHEKVLYERTMKKLSEKKFSSQTISPPVILSLDGEEEQALSRYKEQIAAFGYEIEPFGGKEYAITAIPADFTDIDMKSMFLEMLGDFANLSGRDAPNLIMEKVASMSCKAAVKGNDRLSRPEIEALIDELLQLDNPYNCPHGRPTIISMTKYEIEKKFKRIV